MIGIREAIERVASDAQQRQSCEDELPGYFRVPTGSHVVFYRGVGSGIRVERVLHQRMDFEAHL
jgi:toxin ParE1/3/4